MFIAVEKGFFFSNAPSLWIFSFLESFRKLNGLYTALHYSRVELNDSPERGVTSLSRYSLLF